MEGYTRLCSYLLGKPLAEKGCIAPPGWRATALLAEGLGHSLCQQLHYLLDLGLVTHKDFRHNVQQGLIPLYPWLQDKLLPAMKVKPF